MSQQQYEITTTSAAATSSSSSPSKEAVVVDEPTTLVGSIGEESTRKNDKHHQGAATAAATQPSPQTLAGEVVVTPNNNQQESSSTTTIAVSRTASTVSSPTTPGVVMERQDDPATTSNAVLNTTGSTASDAATDNPNNDSNHHHHPSVMQSVLHRVAVVFPKMEPLPWSTFFVLCAVVAIPTAGYIVLFTSLGLGMDYFYYLDEHYGDYATTAGIATGLFFIVCYLADINYWSAKLLKRFCYLTVVFGICVMVLLMTGDYPYGPIALFAFIMPLWLIGTKKVVHPQVPTRVYVSWLSGPLFCISLVTGVVWLVWTFLQDENEFNDVTKVVFAEATGCVPNLEEYPECALNTTTISINSANSDAALETVEDLCFDIIESPPSFVYENGCDPDCPLHVYGDCLNPFILWAGPLLVGLVLFFLSFFCTFVRSENSDRDIVTFAKLWIFLLFAMWLTASLAGVAAGLAGALIAMTMAAFVGSLIFVAMTRSWEEGKEQATTFLENIKEKYGGWLDVLRALFLITCAPIMVIYLLLSCLNQLVRKCGFPFSKELKTPQTKQDFITKRARKQLTAMQSWDRTKVLSWAIYWGVLFQLMFVIVAQFTVLFLSWLIEKTSSMNLGAVTVILCGVGMIMFLLPPVPGVPIYLTLGIVVIATGREMLGLVGAMFYAFCVSLGLKLVACTVQQKLIGENLAGLVSVRKVVGINSTFVKGMKLVLAQPGMGLDKVSILVGGPDWPTSVLCGIMKLDLIPVLVGTLPIIFLILPTMLLGSFTYMSSLRTVDGDLEFPSAGVLATVSGVITALVQFGSQVIAAYYLQQTISQRSEEIEAIEIDQEVAEAEAKEEHFNNCHAQVTQWSVVPWLGRFALYMAFTCMVFSCYLVTLFSSQCFADYQLTYTIDEHLDGDWTNFVLPVGRAAILLFLLSCVLLVCFNVWAKTKAMELAEVTFQDIPQAKNEPGSNDSTESRNILVDDVEQFGAEEPAIEVVDGTREIPAKQSCTV